MKKIISLIMVISLLVCGCSTAASKSDAAILKDGDTVGSGKTAFSLSIVDDTGSEVKVTVKTDKETVGEALQELNIVSGDKGEYGLYIKTVNGKTFSYEKGGKYWAFYIDGKYAEKSADLTPINPESKYQLKVESM